MKVKQKLLMVVAVVAIIILTVPLFAQLKKLPPDYFPLAVGYWWTYKSVEKGWEFTIRVTGVEKIGDIECFKVETVAANGQVSIIEYYSKPPGKVMWVREEYVTSKQLVDFQPVRVYLHNPLVAKDTWTWKGKGMMEMDIEDVNEVKEMEKVEVPAGKFTAAKVVSKVIQGGAETNKTYWFAPDIGMVKSFTDTGTVKSTMQLTKYNLKVKK